MGFFKVIYITWISKEVAVKKRFSAHSFVGKFTQNLDAQYFYKNTKTPVGMSVKLRKAK